MDSPKIPSRLKCADIIEFGKNFRQYSRIGKKNFICLCQEENKDGLIYEINNSAGSNDSFMVRIVKPNPKKILLALWKMGKISIQIVSLPGKPTAIEIKCN